MKYKVNGLRKKGVMRMIVFAITPMALLVAFLLWEISVQFDFPLRFRSVGLKYSLLKTRGGLTGAEAAQYLLWAEGLSEEVSVLGATKEDCYVFDSKVISLSKDTWGSTSKSALFVAAIAIAFAVSHKAERPHPYFWKMIGALFSLSYLCLDVVTVRRQLIPSLILIPVLIMGAIVGFAPFSVILLLTVFLVPAGVLWANLVPVLSYARSWLAAMRLLKKHGFGDDMAGIREFSWNHIKARLLSTKEPESIPVCPPSLQDAIKHSMPCMIDAIAFNAHRIAGVKE